MLEPPDLSDDSILAAVRTHYGIPVTGLTFLPIGKDYAAWAYRARTADGDAFFLKVREGPARPAALAVPRYLRDRGLTEVVAPVPTRSRALSVTVEDYTLILYPFVDGVMARDRGMDQRHWVTLGAVLRQVHATPHAPDLVRLLRHESFVPAGRDAVQRLEAHLADHTPVDPIERELAAFWHARHTEIRSLVERAETLGQRLRATNPPLVLCHADIHTWNILIDTQNQLWIVDWDETMLAPKERDLMFVVGGIAAGLVRPHEEAWFRTGYGETTVDPLAVAYYRYNWAVEEIGSFGEQVFLTPDTGEATRRDAADLFISVFAPGNIVALAYEASRSIPLR
jgi:spectinomycin phosphotransferase